MHSVPGHEEIQCRLSQDRPRFVHDLANDGENQALVAAMIEMAHTLGIKVIAEGVRKPGAA
jgi:EAL domain-containing protein (putative c-di-GMP-specific phosphodiesterase class I)